MVWEVVRIAVAPRVYSLGRLQPSAAAPYDGSSASSLDWPLSIPVTTEYLYKLVITKEQTTIGGHTRQHVEDTTNHKT